MRAWPAKGRGDGGAAAVEFALVLPLLLMLIFGVIDFGRMMHAQLVVAEAAREAARASALVDNATAEARGEAITDSLGAPSDGGPVTEVTDGCDALPSPDDMTTVTVTFAFRFITPIALGDGDGVTLSSTSVMPCMR